MMLVQGLAISRQHGLCHGVHGERFTHPHAQARRHLLARWIVLQHPIDSASKRDRVAGRDEIGRIGAENLVDAADVGRDQGNAGGRSFEHDIGQ